MVELSQVGASDGLNGLHDLMEIILESIMVAERGEFLAENPGIKGNSDGQRGHGPQGF